MGSFKGLKTLRRIVEDCIKNIHPIYHIKALMIKRELSKDPELANQNWDRFLPKFKKRNVEQKKPKAEKKKPYTPFPPPQLPRKVDLQLESGEYFLSADSKASKKWEAKKEKQMEKLAERKRRRESAFVPPKELEKSYKSSDNGERDQNAMKSDVVAMAESLKKKVYSLTSAGVSKESRGVEDYLASTSGTKGTNRRPLVAKMENQGIDDYIAMNSNKLVKKSRAVGAENRNVKTANAENTIVETVRPKKKRRAVAAENRNVETANAENSTGETVRSKKKKSK